MQVVFRRGSRTNSHRLGRLGLLALMLLVALPSLLLRHRMGSGGSWVLVIVGIGLLVGLVSYVAEFFRMRSIARERGSTRFVVVRGDIARLASELATPGSGEISVPSVRYTSGLALLDTEPPLLEAVQVGADGRGPVVPIPEDSVVTIWHEGDRMRSVEIVFGERLVTLEARGRTPRWASLS